MQNYHFVGWGESLKGHKLASAAASRHPSESDAWQACEVSSTCVGDGVAADGFSEFEVS